jgi:hypothetical protein
MRGEHAVERRQRTLHDLGRCERSEEDDGGRDRPRAPPPRQPDEDERDPDEADRGDVDRVKHAVSNPVHGLEVGVADPCEESRVGPPPERRRERDDVEGRTGAEREPAEPAGPHTRLRKTIGRESASAANA